MTADVNTVRNQYAVQTTDATVTTIASFPIFQGQVLNVKAFVAGKRTGGASGTAGDSAGYELNAVIKNPSGTATIVGGVTQVANEDNTAWDATISVTSGLILITVAGDSGNNVDWACSTKVIKAN